MKKICLASSSFSRRSTLERAGINYEAIAADIDESVLEETPDEYTMRLSAEKSRTVIPKTTAEIVVGADSVVVFEGEIIGKPKSKTHAIEILSKLQGNTHIFTTGMTVVNTTSNTMKTVVEKTEVTFANMDMATITQYVKKFEPYRFAGAYDNDISSWFIQKITGSQSNLRGLPMTTLRNLIESFGYTWAEFFNHT